MDLKDTVHFTEEFYALVSGSTPPSGLLSNVTLVTVTREGGGGDDPGEATRLYANLTTPRLAILPQLLVSVLRGLSRPLPHTLDALHREAGSGLQRVFLEDGALVLDFWHQDRTRKQEFREKRQRRKWTKRLLTDQLGREERLGVEVLLSTKRRDPVEKPDIAALMETVAAMSNATSRHLDEVAQKMESERAEMRALQEETERRIDQIGKQLQTMHGDQAWQQIREDEERFMAVTDHNIGKRTQPVQNRIALKNPQANTSSPGQAIAPQQGQSAAAPHSGAGAAPPGVAHPTPGAGMGPGLGGGGGQTGGADRRGQQSAPPSQAGGHLGMEEEEEIGNDSRPLSGGHGNAPPPAAPSPGSSLPPPGPGGSGGGASGRLSTNSHFEKERLEETVPKGEMMKMLQANGIGVSSTGLGHAVAKRHALAVDLAMVEEEPAPRAQTFDTVLVLDASGSMAGPAFQEMKEVALSFLNSVEDTVTNHSLEENIAVVAITQEGARVKQHLTNDYQRVYDAINSLTPEGPTPYLETFLVCLASLQARAGIVKVGGVHKVRPRIIFITDGKPSDEIHPNQNGTDEPIKNPNARMTLITSLTQFKPDNAEILPNIQWVPVGSATDPASSEFKLLEALTKMGLGEIVRPQERGKLSKHSRIQDAIGKLYAVTRGGRTDNLLTCIDAIYPGLDDADKDVIVAALEDKKAQPEGEDLDGEADNFDQIHMHPEMPPPGTRVMRGPDWRWGDQDSRGCGTVLNHKKHNRVVWVEWDNGTQNVYRCGSGDAYDVLPTDSPRLLGPGQPLQVGVLVVRGPDWHSGQEDGGKGNTGVIIRKRSDGMVKVRWENGFISAYKYEPHGTKEVIVVGRDEGAVPSRQGRISEDEIFNSPVEPLPGSREAGEEGRGARGSGRYGWAVLEHDGTLVAYPCSEIQKLEEAYQKRPTGSCLVSRDGANRRVMFKTMTERDIDESGTSLLRVKRLDEESPEYIQAVAARTG